MFKDKNFQYLSAVTVSVQNDQGSPGSRSKQKYSPKPVNRGQAKSAPNTKNKQQKGRVRAGQGDKCVVPAKSRPKKRGIVTDGSSLSMDNVTWSEETYRTSSLVDMMRTHFPLLVKVTQGYMGEYGAELSTGQVLQIHSCGWQQRVYVQTLQGRGISLPLSHRMDVLPLDIPQSSQLTLQEVMRTHIPPFRAQVMSMSSDPDVSPVNLTGEEVMFERLDDEVFLRANSIIDGWLDQTDVMCIPAFLGAEFACAVGMQAATEGEWADYTNMFKRSIRHLNFSLLQGFSGVVVTNDSAEGGFRYSYYDNKPTVNQPRPREPVKPDSLPSRPVPESPPPEYTSRESTLHHSNPRMPLPSPGAQAEFQSEVVVHSSDSHNYTADPSEGTMYENLVKPTRPESVAYQNVVKVDEEAPPIPPRQKVSGQNSLSPPSRPAAVLPENSLSLPPRPAALLPGSRPDTPFSEVDENDVEDMFAKVIEVAHQEEKRRSLTHSDQELHLMQNTLGVPAHYSNQKEPSGEPPPQEYEMDDRTPPRNSRTPSEGSRNSGAYRSFQTPRAVVQPQIQRVRSDHIRAVNKPSSNGEPASNIQTMEDVPPDIERLSVEDVCQCLHMLNMDPHIPDFRSHQIDGKLLASMKETVLVNEFRFTDFNASKIMRFTRGWRPKLA